MKYLIRSLKIFVCCCLLNQAVTAQQIDSVEYFINTDPGFGNGKGIATTHAANISDKFFTVDLTTVSNGFNNLYVRSHSSNGHWSQAKRWLFFKDIIPATTINQLEYYIDTDPGFGNAIPVTISPGATVPNVFFTVDITVLSNGFHNLFIRSKDNAGNWSVTGKWLFFKDIIPAANVNKLEYYIDTDPGFGNATPVTITPGANIADVFFTVDITSRTNGFHTIFIRSKDNAGNWSVTNKWLFFKDIIPATNVSKLEYFVDTDPGFGNAVNVPITAGANISDLVIPVNTTALSEGFHKIFIRSRDNNGNWSITNRFGFFKEFIPSPLNIKAGEYFFDADPGFGNGTPIPFTDPRGNNIADFSFGADISTLTNNTPHYLFVRTLDSSNKWSLTNVVTFTKMITIPVTWLSFDAKLVNKVVQLDWKTATESNSSHFEIERSINGYQFENIGRVKAAGNSNSITSYNFTDRLPVKGMNYYRLKQVDLDGVFNYSEIRKAEIKTGLPLFALYNSPSNGSAIMVKTTNTPAFLGIFDIAGKKLKEITIVNHTQQIDLSALPSGIYTAVLYKESSVIAVEKLLIQH